MGTDTEGNNPDGGGKPKGNDKHVNVQKKSFPKKPFISGIQGIKHVKFEGASSDIKGHVFDVMSSKIKQIDEYNSTLEQIMILTKSRPTRTHLLDPRSVLAIIIQRRLL